MPFKVLPYMKCVETFLLQTGIFAFCGLFQLLFQVGDLAFESLGSDARSVSADQYYLSKTHREQKDRERLLVIAEGSEREGLARQDSLKEDSNTA